MVTHRVKHPGFRHCERRGGQRPRHRRNPQRTPDRPDPRPLAKPAHPTRPKVPEM